MTLMFIRIFFFILSGVVGFYIGSILESNLLGLELGLLSGLVLIFLERRLHKVSVRGLSSMVFGLLLGIVMAKLISDILFLLPLGLFVQSTSRGELTIIFSYLGAVIALRGKDEFNIIIPYVRFRRQDVREENVLLDTSAIIDGRIFEIYKSKFVPGRLIVPEFVLKELQKLADSQDEQKRQKGRRGIDLLNTMQKDPKIDVRIREDELAIKDDVDTELVRLAKLIDAKVCTTDYNLSRVAVLQNVDILNVHELFNAMKFVIFVGQKIEVKLVKEGKESDQALAYLEDGTMIVVAGAKHLLGRSVKVIITSVLQNQAGKMVFAKLAYEEGANNNQ